MGAGHDHHHPGRAAAGAGHGDAHDHAAGANARSLTIALAIIGVFLVVEVAGAYLFNSLALLSDAAHMFNDGAALAIALAAIRIGQRPADKRRTYGYRRFELLAAAFNALLLLAVAAFILIEGIGRLINPVPVASLGMLAVAVLGLLANLAAMRVLSAGRGDSLNMRGAYLEVWADMLGSLGVIAAAVIIVFTGWLWLDPVVAIGIGAWVLPRTGKLLSETVHVLLQGVPAGIDLDEIRAGLNGLEGVADTHDLHVWSVAGDDATLTAHVTLLAGSDADAVRIAAAAMLEQRFGIGHATIQTEAEACEGGVLHA